MKPLQKQSYFTNEVQDNWFIPDKTLSIGNDIYIPSELKNNDDWYLRCADAWEICIAKREKEVKTVDFIAKELVEVDKNKIQFNSKSDKQFTLPPPPPPLPISPYVVTLEDNDHTIKILDITSDTEGYLPLIKDEKLDTLPTFFRDIKMILIPRKAKRILQRVSRSELKEIDTNKNVAIEKCLLVLSNLTDTQYLKMYYTRDKRWKALSSKILHSQTKKGKKVIYTKILTLLKELKLIKVHINPESVESFQQGISSKQYRLTDELFDAGYTQYIILEEEIIQARRDIERGKVSENKDNIIVKNILEARKRLLIPTLKLVLDTGIKLTKQKGGYSKKSKKLIYLNKRSRSNYDSKEFMFVEDHIKLYKALFDSLSYPKVGSTNSGHRVTSFLNLVPSWIRKLFKIDGEETIEPDIVTSHPNIVMNIYGGSRAHISHDNVAKYLNIDRDIAKKEHLSFFNKHPNHMKKSDLYKYYMKNEPDMMKNLLEEKSKYGYKITSKHLLLKETEVMSYAIEFLNKKNMYVGYIFDGLQCKKSDAKIVKQAIDNALQHFNINTTSSIS